jgi:hypothetical protein
MSPQAINHGGGVDSGGAERTCGRVAVDRLILGTRIFEAAVSRREDEESRPRLEEYRDAVLSLIQAQSRLLTKSLCTLQALVSNMEESGEGVQHVARALLNHQGFGFYTDPMEGGQDAYDISCEALVEAQIAITAVLGTFDLEALKTLVGEIDDVLGGAE